MSIPITNVGYGLTNALQQLSPQPIVAKRDPKTTDRAEVGTVWVNTTSQAYWINAGTIANVTTWTAQTAGSLAVASLTINGAGTFTGGTGLSAFNGDVTIAGDLTVTGDFDIVNPNDVLIESTAASATAVVIQATDAAGITTVLGAGGLILGTTNAALTANTGTGAISISTDAAATTLDIGTGAGAKTVTLGSLTTTSFTTISGGTLGIEIQGVGDPGVTPGVKIDTNNSDIVLNSGTGGVNISNDAFASTVLLGTGAGAKTVTLGSTNTTSTTTIQSGSGGVLIPNGVNPITISGDAAATTVSVATGAGAKTLLLGSTNTTSTSTLRSGSGGVLINNGVNPISISSDAAATTLLVGTGAGAKTVTVGSTNTTSTTTINAGSGGLALGVGAGGAVSMVPGTSSTASGGANTAVTLSTRVGVSTITGATTAAGVSATITLTNTNILTTSGIQVTIANIANVNDAKVAITGIKQSANTLVVTYINNGAAAVDGNILLSFWIFS